MKLCAIVFELHNMPIAMSAMEGTEISSAAWASERAMNSASEEEWRKKDLGFRFSVVGAKTKPEVLSETVRSDPRTAWPV